MALFSRLFSPRKSNKNDSKNNTTDKTFSKEYKPFTHSFDKNCVRILLFRECDWRGRKLLFDSTSVEKVPIDPKVPLIRHRSDSSEMIVEVSKGYGYKYKKPHADTNSLGETIFGSIAMASRGPSIKVHSIKEPARIMFTKVIQAPRSGGRRRQFSDDKALDDSQGSSMNSMADSYNNGSYDSKKGSFEATLDDSGFGGGRETCSVLNTDWFRRNSPQQCSCTSHCPLHPPNNHSFYLEEGDHANSSSSLQSGGSLSSLRRRWARSVATSLEFNDAIQPPSSTGKHTKLGVALIIPLVPSCSQEMEQFLLDRLPLMNNILTRLQHSTERAYCRRDVFVQSMLQASINAIQSVFELVCGSRLEKPLWLTLTSDKTNASEHTDLANKLVSDLSHLLATMDTKHTNFFISTLLTAVLTHHLGWVSTVFTDMPSQSNDKLADLSKSHPYNPLWAQLSDLQGALGYPPKIAKTVVVGRSEILVQKLLSILSYFIRCGHVQLADMEREVPPDEENLLEQLLEHNQEIHSFDKDAIREFSKAGSMGGKAFSSTSTLTKSKTVLSMKTFSITDIDICNANSLESGFESCNDISGDSYEDASKINKSLQTLQSFTPKLGKSRSCAKLIETSFSQNIIQDTNCRDDDDKQNCVSPPVLLSNLSVARLNESVTNVICKMESEKQFTSPHLHDMFNKFNSKSSLSNPESQFNSFTKRNLLHSKSIDAENKENKVVFVLGENEELVNIKGQDEANSTETFTEPAEIISNISLFGQPTIVISVVDVDDPEFGGERCETENKTDFTIGDISSRVVIVRPTPIELENTISYKSSTTKCLHRCLSVPEEVMTATAKASRSRETAQLLQRWLSDSAIVRTLHKPDCVMDSLVCVSKLSSAMPASVFRTSNRSLKDTSVDLGESIEHLENESLEVPIVAVEDVELLPSLPIDDYINLPSQSCAEPCSSHEVGVAASLYGGVSDQYSPELTLQGVTSVPHGWVLELQHSLLLEAHAGDVNRDLSEAVCIVANTDTWEVGVVSSHLVTVDQGTEVGMRVGMSQLVGNLLETTQHLCNLSLPATMCLSHVETKLFELCLRSQALAELLLSSDFLDIATLAATLDIDANDVPLLLSVASTHTPQVTHKYGLSFQ